MLQRDLRLSANSRRRLALLLGHPNVGFTPYNDNAPPRAAPYKDHEQQRASRSLRLLSGAKNHIDSGLAGDLRDTIRPTTGKRAASYLDALAQRCYAGRFGGPFDTKSDLEHVLRCGPQINVNLKSAILDRSLHENLRFQQRHHPNIAAACRCHPMNSVHRVERWNRTSIPSR